MSDPGKTQCLQLIEGLETICARCRRELCLRQQVLNLALGAEQDLLCLTCLAQDNGNSREQMLANLGPYVISRECFAREWKKYGDRGACPDPVGCLPENCFSFT